ncbi:hypothetical protein CSZ94_26970 [Janthinobacterium sp. ROICE36]|uniref:hypothetical protein n=1 Tax=Janthinobacterium sp. ROICE36 TaxID=2048670 RepID=UPI000C7F2D73|nr:hypothetical protein [Janthinobacterium sp. ROICE36]PLY39344.1 hypothetical protein CSZ94_26970 [Janthinobacterium sp. ROICE36]
MPARVALAPRYQVRGPSFSKNIMSSENQNVASRTIAFLASLHGHHEHHVDGRAAVLDLLTGIAYVPNLDYEDAVMLTMIAPGGAVIADAVHTHKVVEAYLVRYAQAMAIADGGSVQAQYEHIQQHFAVKTGS